MSDSEFQSLVDAHYAALYRFALSLARTQADACDLVQQTFYIWARQGHALRDRGRAKAWLFTTLHREFLTTRRRSRIWSEEDVDETTVDAVSDGARDADLRLDADSVVQALGAVDEAFRAPLALFYLQELTYLEIAELLEVPIGTVMSRISRGKAQLRQRLENPLSQSDVIPFPNSPKKRRTP